MSIEFDVLPQGQWLRGRDLVDHWVLFIVKDTEAREGTFGTEIVATVDFADLTAGDEQLLQDCKISDKHVTSKLRPGKKIVGRIGQSVPKQKGFKGAIYLEQPNGEEYAKHVAIAKDIMSSTKARASATASDNLKDLFE